MHELIFMLTRSAVTHASQRPPATLTHDLALEVAGVMQALATPSRLLILDRLRAGPCSVGELARAVAMEQSAVSHQLRLLRHLGLVVGRRQGRRRIYDLHDPHVGELLEEAIGHSEHMRLGRRGTVGAAASSAAGTGHDHPDPDHRHGPGRHGHAGVDASVLASREAMRTLKLSLVILGATAFAQVVVVVLSGAVAPGGPRPQRRATRSPPSRSRRRSSSAGDQPRRGSPTATGAPRTWLASRSS